VQPFRGLSQVVDLGCGRGEFLELLKQSGIDAYGVDSDPVACNAARRKHLTVLQADLFDQYTARQCNGLRWSSW
jgi:O-antigen chain-terminating methyltransferase